MNPEELYDLLAVKPFRPVRVYLRSGEVYEILRRDLVVVGWTYLDIGIQAPDESPGIACRVDHLSLDDIEKVETLDQQVTLHRTAHAP